MEDINTKEGGKVEEPWGKSLMVSSKDYQVDAANSCVYMKMGLLRAKKIVSV